MKQLFFGFVLSLVLAGCGTSVPLSDVPVSDATAKPVSTSGAPVPAATSTGVAPVDLTKSAAPMAPVSEKRVIYFDYDSFVIKPEFQSLIAEHARQIKAQSGRRAIIEGHTDERGGREYNLALGQKRAEAVVGALTVLGVSGAQLEAVSFGKEKPAVQGADETVYAKNRRAEIRYQ
ncbi:MAG: peptidoglycan-associated lipoprotein Pal [Rhodoferax sp.]|nr:peptidoglycan-associated lipoprotein Pal [Rhodoferax sp.]PIW09948.1 MAG: peptidoglycan-associated lipoprotein [Comamonadaceae bacterium CG17_big_fil_post_rev_8_21_14_2_50_60_13]PJC15152.1 MAG: peptidoglycan-associated lipoprotein [Comamonadaceae bacterium CG_4_9_14_0_8_um_filter_60_18]